MQLPIDLDTLDPEQIRAELDDLERRRDALRILLRAALARQRGRERQQSERKGVESV